MSYFDYLIDPQRTESICDICGGHNPVWFAPNEVWNLGGTERPGFECPSCFSAKYQKTTGQRIIWRFEPDTINAGVKE